MDGNIAMLSSAWKILRPSTTGLQTLSTLGMFITTETMMDGMAVPSLTSLPRKAVGQVEYLLPELQSFSLDLAICLSPTGWNGIT